MAIDKKFIHFKTYDNFISHNGIGSEVNITTPTEGSEDTGDAIYGQIKGSSVVFIKDVQKMWTHGQLYDCRGGGNMSEQDPVFMASPAATITEVKKTEWDNKVDKVSGKQLSTEDFTTALKSKLEGLSNYDDTELSNALATLRGDFDKLVSGDTTTAIKTFNEVIAFLDGLTDTQDLESIIASIEQQIAGKMDKVTLATVATSGSYNDLSNKPTIPSAVTESTVSGWGFTKNTGTYSKPSGGIPKSDLTSEVQTSLGKADTALQSYTEQYKGTITGVSANGTSVATSGVANIPAASTSKYGVTKLSSATNSTSTTLAATASAVKSVYDLANGKQDRLVSGTNIKTVNGTSILGSGDITISGGSSDANVQAVDTGDVLDDVTVAYATTAYVDNKVANISLTDYATIAYVDGLIGDINSVLESIISGGSGGGVSLITFTIGGLGGSEYQAEEGMTWEEWINSEYNTDDFYINAGLIYGNGRWLGCYITGVTSSDIILNSVYHVDYTGGGA